MDSFVRCNASTRRENWCILHLQLENTINFPIFPESHSQNIGYCSDSQECFVSLGQFWNVVIYSYWNTFSTAVTHVSRSRSPRIVTRAVDLLLMNPINF